VKDFEFRDFNHCRDIPSISDENKKDKNMIHQRFRCIWDKAAQQVCVHRSAFVRIPTDF
jgi:hypothetical protein